MATTVAERLSNVHPKMLAAQSEGLRKKLVVGRRVERALELLGITKQDAAFRMGYSDSSVLSRWFNATERPQFDKLEAIDGFDGAYAIALAENNPGMEVETFVRIRVKRLALVAVLLAVAVPAFAQDAAPQLVTCFGTAACYRADGQFAGVLRDPAVPPFVVKAHEPDPLFDIAQGALFSAFTADIAITEYGIGKGKLREVGLAPWASSPIAFGATKGALAAFAIWSLARLEAGGHRRAATILAFVLAGAEVGLAAHNAQLAGRR